MYRRIGAAVGGFYGLRLDQRRRAVSYTHLDVYKRQTQESRAATEAVNETGKVDQVAENEAEKPKRMPIVKPKKVGRNDPCPCGSGLKFKNCHGKDGATSYTPDAVDSQG